MTFTSALFYLVACGEETGNPNNFNPREAGGGGSTDEGGSSSGGDGDVDAANVAVKVLNLDSTQGIAGNDVTNWLDSSGNNNTGAAVGGPLPVEAAIYGKRAVRFDGTKYLEVADSPSLQMGTGNFLLAAVVLYTPTTTDKSHVIVSKSSRTEPLNGPALMANYAFLPGAPTDQSTSVAALLRDGTKATAMAAVAVPQPEVGKPHLIVLHRRGQTFNIRVDRQDRGLGLVTETILDTSAPGTPLRLGGDNSPGRGLIGHIGEVVMYRGNISDRTLGDIEGALSNKWLRPPVVPDGGADGGDAGDGG
jgi:hypothetical protein